MPRKATISCTDKQFREIERLSNSRTDEVRLVGRAKIIISCLSGKWNDEIAKAFNIRQEQ